MEFTRAWPARLYPSPPASDGARSRRSQSSSESSSPRGSFGISVAKYRVGAPPLRPLPLAVNTNDGHYRLAKPFAADFIERARKLLMQYRVASNASDFDNGKIAIFFTCRCVPHQPETTQPMVEIVVNEWTSKSADDWANVARDLKQYMDCRLDDPASQGIDMGVEMIARDLTIAKYMTAVEDMPALQNQWNEIRGTVRRILESFDSINQHISAISLFKFGAFEYDYEDRLWPVGDHPITIYIAVDYESDETTWIPAIARIEDYLSTLPYDLRVHMENNDVKRYSFDLLAPTTPLTAAQQQRAFLMGPYTERVNMGADIGPAHYLQKDDGTRSNPGAGTLGCYLQMKKNASSDWVTMALTCYHVLRPAFPGFTLKISPNKPTAPGELEPGSKLRRADTRGFGPNLAADCPRIENPTRAMHNLAVCYLDGVVLEEKDAGNQADAAITKATRDRKVAFFDQASQLFGTMFAGSGYLRQTADNSRLDWALVAVDASNRVGQNLVPNRGYWVANGSYAPSALALGENVKPQTTSLRDMESGDRVFKIGAVTYGTAGTYSSFCSDINFAEDRYLGTPPSSEHIVIGEKNAPFGINGDSGAVVFDNGGGIVGLLISGHAPHQSQNERCQGLGVQSYCIVTPIEDVLEDIKKSTGWMDVRLAEQ